MAASVEVLNFVADTGGTTTTLTTSFEGKAVILFTHGKTSEGESAGASFCIGFSDGTNHRCMGWGGDDAVATTNAGFLQNLTEALQVVSSGSPTVPTGGHVTGVAFNPTTMVLTFNTTPSAAWEISAIVFGGADITNVFVGSDTVLTSVAAKNVTGVGFQGDAAFFISARSTASSGADALPTLGFATSSTKEWSLYGLTDDAEVDVPDARSRIVSDATLSAITKPTTVDYKADFTQWTADGFDLNFSNAAAALYPFCYLVLKGGQWDGGVQAKPTGATTQTFNVAFVPKAIGFAMCSATALDTNTDTLITTVGAWDGTTEVYAGAYHNNAFNTVATSSGASTKLLHEMNTTTGADGTTLAADTVITWDATGTAYQVAWWAVGDSSTPAEFETSIINASRMTLALNSNIEFDTAISAAATTASALTTEITPAASVSGVATTAGILTTSILFAASITGLAQASATASTANAFDADVFAEAQADGDLTTSITMASSVSGVATTTSALTTSIRMATSVSGVASGDAALTTEITLASDVSGVATGLADLYVPGGVGEFEADALATANAEATLQTTALLASSISSTATTAGILDTSIVMLGAATGAATTAGVLETTITLSGAASGIATAEAILFGANDFTASVTATATAEADLTVPRAVVSMSNLHLAPTVSMGGFQISPAVTVDSVSLNPV